MPFHDTAICIEGQTATDLAFHFVHLWNNVKFVKHGKTGREHSITTKSKSFFHRVFRMDDYHGDASHHSIDRTGQKAVGSSSRKPPKTKEPYEDYDEDEY